MKIRGGRHRDLVTHKNKTEKFYPVPWCHWVTGRNWKQQVFMFDAFFWDPKALRDSQTFKIRGFSPWSWDKTSLQGCLRDQAGWGTHVKAEILKRKGKGSHSPTPILSWSLWSLCFLLDWQQRHSQLQYFEKWGKLTLDDILHSRNE